MSTLSEASTREPERPPLSVARMDPERRIGFPAGRFTQPGAVLSLILAAVLTVCFYGGLLWLGPDRLIEAFTGRGWVPYVIVALSSWALTILLIKWAKIRVQERALQHQVAPKATGFTLTPDSAEQVLDRLHRIAEEPGAFLLYDRIQFALSNLRNLGRVSDVGDILGARSETDEAAIESSYTVVRGLIWAVPVLGFVGTVIGLSDAIGSFSLVLDQAGEMDQLRDSLRSVTGGLATAFQTTLQALLGALMIQLVMTLVRRKEERMLDRFNDYCDRQIIGRLRLHKGDETPAGKTE